MLPSLNNLFSRNKGNKSLTALVTDTSGLSVAAVNIDGERPRLDTCDYTPCPGGASEQLISDKVKQYGLHKRPCTTVMNLGDYRILNVDAPDVPPAELRGAIRWQIKDLIDFHIDDAVIDVFDAPPSSATGKKNNMYVVATKMATVRERADQLQAAQTQLTTIDIPELALTNLTRRLPEDETGVCFVYLTADRGLIIVTRQQTLYFARTLDIGYQGLRHDQHAPGQQDSNAQTAQDSDNLERLVLEVQRTLDYYDRYFTQPSVAGLVLAPMEIELPGLGEYLHQSLGLAVRTLDLGEILDFEQPLNHEQQAHCLLAVSAALREKRISL